MMNESTTYAAASQSVVRDFLQAVLVVDDRAECGRQGATVPRAPLAKPETQAARSRSIVPPLVAPPALPSEHAEVTEGRLHSLDAGRLVDAFAAEGLVCGVLIPRDGAEAVARTPAVARRADVLVLDWSIADSGEAALEIIESIASTDDDRRLRFIVIYTAESGLSEISRRIRERLDAIGEVSSQCLDTYLLVRGSLKIAIFGKPDRTKSYDLEQEERRVSESDLPGRLIVEYARCLGMISTAALSAVASIRNKTSQLLDRFDPNLDPSYLVHRARQKNPEDAEQHVLDIIVSEIGAVIEDSGIKKILDIDACLAWIESRGSSAFTKDNFGGNTAPSSENYRSLLTNGFGNGASAQITKSTFPKLKDGRIFEKAAFFASDADAMKRSNENLAQLMSLRHRYDAHEPSLTTGTIIRSTTGAYYVCMMPACDAVRLEDARRFVCLPLEVATDESVFKLVVPFEGMILRLTWLPKMYAAEMITFKPTDSDRITATRSDEGCTFTSTTGNEYAYVAELKSPKAQALAHELAHDFERPGVDDSEWLRAGMKQR